MPTYSCQKRADRIDWIPDTDLQKLFAVLAAQRAKGLRQAEGDDVDPGYRVANVCRIQPGVQGHVNPIESR